MSEAKTKTSSYVLKPGNKHYGFDIEGKRKLFEGGDSIELTEEQFKGIKDKVITDSDAAFAAEAANAKDKAEALAEENEKLKAELEAMKIASAKTATVTPQAPKA